MIVYRIRYRGYGRKEWWSHTSRSGTQLYTTLGAVKGAVTRLKRENARYNDDAGYEYLIESATIGEWTDTGIRQEAKNATENESA